MLLFVMDTELDDRTSSGDVPGRSSNRKNARGDARAVSAHFVERRAA